MFGFSLLVFGCMCVSACVRQFIYSNESVRLRTNEFYGNMTVRSIWIECDKLNTISQQ